MSTTTAKRRQASRMALVAIVIAVVVGGFGVAMSVRGPEKPSMGIPLASGAPVHLPDGRTLYVQQFEVSVAEWNACHDAGACTLEL